MAEKREAGIGFWGRVGRGCRRASGADAGTAAEGSTLPNVGGERKAAKGVGAVCGLHRMAGTPRPGAPMLARDGDARPPPAPSIERRLRLHPAQWIGVPLLLLVPLLAVLGLFGEARETLDAHAAAISVEANHPTRSRHGLPGHLWLEVRNDSPGVIDTVTVELDPAYAAGFSKLEASPAFERPYLIRLVEVNPGESRRVRLEFEQERYGWRRGELRVRSSGGDTARIRLRTFIFP